MTSTQVYGHLTQKVLLTAYSQYIIHAISSKCISPYLATTSAKIFRSEFPPALYTLTMVLPAILDRIKFNGPLKYTYVYMNGSVRCVTREKWKRWSIFTAPYWYGRGKKEMVRLMNEIMERRQELEGKGKVVCVVDKACENGRVERKWRGCIENVWIE